MKILFTVNGLPFFYNKDVNKEMFDLFSVTLHLLRSDLRLASQASNRRKPMVGLTLLPRLNKCDRPWVSYNAGINLIHIVIYVAQLLQ